MTVSTGRGYMSGDAWREAHPAGTFSYPKTPEHKAKLSAALMGHEVSAERREKMGAARRGRPLTLEHRAAIAAGLAARYADREFRDDLRLLVPDEAPVGECVYCGALATQWDHVEPRRHGKNHGRACVCYRLPACSTCNASKGRHTPEEWLAVGLYRKVA